MDKLKLTAHIKDIDLKNKMFRIIDKANGSLKNYDVRFSDFLNPFEVESAKAILNANDDLKYTVDGGYDESERKIVFIYPFYMYYEDINETLRFIQIEGNFKFKSISHKDYLGSLLSLGIKREKIGDIIIHENFCQVIVTFDICDFILMNLEKVARNNVKLKEISRKEVVYNPPNYKEINFTVSSSRIDCIISGLYNISRQESAKLISNEKVQVNYEKITSCSKEIKSESLISVRGKGRSQINNIGSLTKKGKVKVQGKLLL
ncbi:MAG: YlmH/Sll1252 family protein [Terrisporobacter othiniensis]|uniref:YlmH family RNA-binding protein n=1 Tax=Terrisporobacter petrolearius TaxID=1460447 RepID=UPI0022DF1509|nr:YlmH/Sll1252 family protein [Terrisporobacter petrolearius]MDU4859497.1 YlmH/Sll1252 family protein [Terrisporobacter othiniensis]MDU6993884.1 YlmH/Sll1252 family protein [Terrisporobacter othiniensis]